MLKYYVLTVIGSAAAAAAQSYIMLGLSIGVVMTLIMLERS